MWNATARSDPILREPWFLVALCGACGAAILCFKVCWTKTSSYACVKKSLTNVYWPNFCIGYVSLRNRYFDCHRRLLFASLMSFSNGLGFFALQKYRCKSFDFEIHFRYRLRPAVFLGGRPWRSLHSTYVSVRISTPHVVAKENLVYFQFVLCSPWQHRYRSIALDSFL